MIEPWGTDVLCLFSKDSRVYLQDWNKKKITQEIYVRDKVDHYCIDQFDELENKILDEEFKVTRALFNGILF